MKVASIAREQEYKHKVQLWMRAKISGRGIGDARGGRRYEVRCYQHCQQHLCWRQVQWPLQQRAHPTDDWQHVGWFDLKLLAY